MSRSSGALEAGFRQHHEGAGAVRQAFAERRQAVFFLGAHLAEGLIETVGLEHRIVAETTLATRRPDGGAVDCGLKLFEMTVGPGQTQRGDETRAPLFRPGWCR